MKKTLFTAISLVLSSGLFAQNLEQVYTSDGSVYEGYICEQVPGKSISVFAEKADIVLATKEIKNIRKDYIQFSALPSAAQDIFRAKGDSTYISVISFEYKDICYDNVYLTSKNDVSTRIMSFLPKTYKLGWDNITKTVRTGSESSVYGIKDIVTLNTGEQYSGAIAQQIIGKNTTIKEDDGTVRIVGNADILSIRYKTVSDEVSLWEQARLLDRIEIDGGRVVEGFISARVFGKKLYIKALGSDFEEVYNLVEIKKYQKFLNRKYKEYVEPEADTTRSVKVNGVDAAISKPCSVKDRSYLTEKDRVLVKVGERFNVELKNVECDKSFSLLQTSIMTFTDKSSEVYYGQRFPAFKSSDWPIYECAAVKNEDSTTTAEVVIRKKGTYFLVIDSSNNGIIIEAE